MTDDQPTPKLPDPLDDPAALRVALDYLRDGGFDREADWFAAQLNRAVKAKAEGAMLGYFTFKPEPTRRLEIDVPPDATDSDLGQILSDVNLVVDDMGRDRPSLLGGLADRMRDRVEARRPVVDGKRARREVDWARARKGRAR